MNGGTGTWSTCCRASLAGGTTIHVARGREDGGRRKNSSPSKVSGAKGAVKGAGKQRKSRYKWMEKQVTGGAQGDRRAAGQRRFGLWRMLLGGTTCRKLHGEWAPNMYCTFRCGQGQVRQSAPCSALFMRSVHASATAVSPSPLLFRSSPSLHHSPARPHMTFHTRLSSPWRAFDAWWPLASSLLMLPGHRKSRYVK